VSSLQRPVLLATVALTAVLIGACGLFGPDVGVDGVDADWVQVDNQPGREALVVVPAGFDPETADALVPAVIVLHGLGADGEEMARLAEWPAAARDRGFVAVFPQGEENSWNAGGCCGLASEQGVDDVAMLDSLIDQLVAEEGVDPERIYLTGYSNGGMMTYMYICRRADLLAGAASVAGTDFDDECDPTAAVPFLQISGEKDPVVPVLGGKSAFPDLPDTPSVEESVQAVAEGAGCSPASTTEPEGLQRFESSGCRDGVTVRYDVVAGLDHSYPSSAITPQYVAVDQILDFWGFAPAQPAQPDSPG
jgi:polyhydroxybutyrate depolymerase